MRTEQENKIQHPIFKGLDKSELFADVADVAHEKMAKIGFPERRSEEWKYTRVNKLLKSNYSPKKSIELKQLDN